MATWPSTLPNEPFTELQGQPADNRLRTDMDAGPTKMRRRYTAKRIFYNNVEMYLDGDQLQTLQDFYNNDLNGGTLKFDWDDPVDGTTVQFRFRSPYQYVITAGGTTSKRVYLVTMQLEQMP